MKHLSTVIATTILFSFFSGSILLAQSDSAETIQSKITQEEITFHISFLAADEFLGRDTGTQELRIASRYIAELFRLYGIEHAEGYDTYFQDVPLERLTEPDAITFAAGDSTYTKSEDLILFTSYRGELNAPVIFLEYATEDELAENDVEGKIVIANAGLPGQTSPQQLFMSVNQKNEWVDAAGAVALIELYTNPQFPWQILIGFLGGDRLDIANNDADFDMPHFWMHGNVEGRINHLQELAGEEVNLLIEGEAAEVVRSRNVIGVLRGTDPELRDEYLLLGAHYDHIGVVDGHPEPITSEYIYNGARDNAVGTTGIISAARYFAENPPRRSVIFAAWTAEEVGLLGSRYYSDNPMIPLENTIFNLNIDSAGYNDTTKVTIFGLDRTDAEGDIIAGAAAFGLEAIPDPAPEQNLFDRSDNVNFARNGIPAPTFSLGFTAFDDEVNYYYHQVTDEPHTVNFPYITNYIRAFIYTANSIANRDEAPFWTPGDVYEQAGIELYGLE